MYYTEHSARALDGEYMSICSGISTQYICSDISVIIAEQIFTFMGPTHSH